mgnify:CR=1 FL=1
MKFTNKRVLPIYKIGYALLITLVSVTVIYNYLILNQPFFTTKESIILLVLYAFVVLYWYKIAKYVEFDSAGSGLVFITRGILLSDFINHREHRVELPKSKLQNYSILNLVFFKKVVLHIKSKHRIKKIKVNISFLSHRNTKALKIALDKIVRENS